jgi:glycosyltransferase involved in cell wall biosynthesis
MKIAIDARAASQPQPGGFKTYTLELIKHIAAVDPASCYLFYLDRAMDANSLVQAPNVALRIIPTHVPGVGAVWREQAQVPRQLTLDQATLAHFTTNTAPLRAPCPTVLSVHDAIGRDETPPSKGMGPRESLKRWGMYLYNRYFSLASARRASRIITVSEYSRRDLVARLGLPAERVVVTNEAPSDSFRPLSRSVAQEAVRNRFGLQQPFLLALSSASPRKNAQGLLAAYAQLEPELRAGSQLVIVWTHGLWRDQLAARVRRLGLEGRVVFLDNVSDHELLILYNAANVFVFPSLAEGFGLPPLEAMACGTPVVASNLTCLPDILGDAALLVDPRASGEFAKALAKALRTPQLLLELSAKGRAWVRRYSWERCARETAQVYADVFAEFNSRHNV